MGVLITSSTTYPFLLTIDPRHLNESASSNNSPFRPKSKFPPLSPPAHHNYALTHVHLQLSSLAHNVKLTQQPMEILSRISNQHCVIRIHVTYGFLKYKQLNEFFFSFVSITVHYTYMTITKIWWYYIQTKNIFKN